MNKIGFKFPHLPRLFSASQRNAFVGPIAHTALWMLLIGVVGINIHNAMTLPLGVTNVLGQSHKRTRTKLSTQPEYEQIRKEYSYWQTVIATRPDYRDGYTELVILAYRLGLMKESKTYLDHVLRLDPNYPGALQLKALFSQN